VIRIAEPQIGDAERAAVSAVLDSGQLAGGPVVRTLEAAFARDVAGTAHAVAVNSGTAALHLVLLALDIGAGDEVITTPFSFQATANMVLAVGARPVFVDVGADANIDPALIEAAITPRTKAILPVHLYGRLCAIEQIAALAQRRGLHLIEDACQAHGAARGGRRAGSFGIGCFSFYATKNLTAGEGGMLTTDDAALAARLRRLRNHGEDERFDSVELGYNYRLTDVAAAIAIAQLERLSAATARRRANAAYLSAHLRGVDLPPAPPTPESHVWHQYTVRVGAGRDDLAAWLREREIETGVYYPLPIPTQRLYRDRGYAAAPPLATRLAAEVLSLPVHPGLSQADLERIVSAVNEWTAARQGAVSSRARPA
jgi:dTDP-4-amino-4,6-dideoxygalactose transaminase